MKAKLKLPIVDGKPAYWPQKPVCPVCRKHKVLEPHSMAILAVGALRTDRKKKCSQSSDDLDGFLSLIWHGAHNGGRGHDKDIGCIVDVVRNSFGGQADLYFCSTKCLRQFLNTCVDALEQKIEKERVRISKQVQRVRRK